MSETKFTYRRIDTGFYIEGKGVSKSFELWDRQFAQRFYLPSQSVDALLQLLERADDYPWTVQFANGLRSNITLQCEESGLTFDEGVFVARDDIPAFRACIEEISAEIDKPVSTDVVQREAYGPTSLQKERRYRDERLTRAALTHYRNRLLDLAREAWRNGENVIALPGPPPQAGAVERVETLKSRRLLGLDKAEAAE